MFIPAKYWYWKRWKQEINSGQFSLFMDRILQLNWPKMMVKKRTLMSIFHCYIRPKLRDMWKNPWMSRTCNWIFFFWGNTMAAASLWTSPSSPAPLQALQGSTAAALSLQWRADILSGGMDGCSQMLMWACVWSLYRLTSTSTLTRVPNTSWNKYTEKLRLICTLTSLCVFFFTGAPRNPHFEFLDIQYQQGSNSNSAICIFFIFKVK